MQQIVREAPTATDAGGTSQGSVPASAGQASECKHRQWDPSPRRHHCTQPKLNNRSKAISGPRSGRGRQEPKPGGSCRRAEPWQKRRAGAYVDRGEADLFDLLAVGRGELQPDTSIRVENVGAVVSVAIRGACRRPATASVRAIGDAKTIST